MREFYAFFAATIDFILVFFVRLLSKIKLALFRCQGEVGVCRSGASNEPAILGSREEKVTESDLVEGRINICLQERGTDSLNENSQQFSNELTRKMDFYEAIPEHKWNLLHQDQKNGIFVWSLKTDEPTTHATYKIEAIFANEQNLTVESIFNQYWNLSNRFKWDENCMNNALIKQISPDSRIIHFKSKPHWPATSRDAVLLNQRNLKNLPEVADNLYVESEMVNVPLDKNTVRMTVLFQGQRIRLQRMQNGNSQIKILQMIVGNPNGWIPEAIVKRVTTKAIPTQLLQVKKLAIEEETSKNACVNTPKISNSEILARLEAIEDKLDALLGKKSKKIDLKNITGSFIGCLLVHVISYNAIKRFCTSGKSR
jgi:hypothetical protein